MKIPFNLGIILGATLLGAALMAFQSATGYLAHMADARAGISPTYYLVLGFFGGGLYSLRFTMDRIANRALVALIAVASGAVLASVCWAFQVYHLGTWVGHLDPLGAAIFGGVLIGSITALSVFIAGKRR